MATKKTPSKSRNSRTPGARPRAVAAPDDTGASPGLSFPVVAVGASAGGLAAFTALLKALPAQSGMAFVLIQHLEPKHESALTALLSKATKMPVVEVSDGLAVEPDHVYVIPPNKGMTIREGNLLLAPRAEASRLLRPIDDFLIALAEEQGNRAIGVVLSGTGSDGTYGLKAIKAAGGVTFAQDPKTAQWTAMPMSAITAGSADFVASPKRIAAELTRIGRHPYLAEAQEVAEGSDLDKVCLILRSAIGVDFRLYKQATVRRRIARRMALHKIASLHKYALFLKQHRDEAQALSDDIFIHVTSFFRDPECFDALKTRVLARLHARNIQEKRTSEKKASGKRVNDEPIRIWVAGCSTGEEVYSIAMLLLEEPGEQPNRTRIQIFGTDIQERSLEHARSGIYSGSAVAGVSPERLKRFFVETDHGYQIQKSIRDLCVFARHDLTHDPPFSRLDLVSCRNVLIYMGPALQKRILSMFQYGLKPGGFLLLGNSESLGDYSEAFMPADPKHRIFARKPSQVPFREIGGERDELRETHSLPPRTAAPVAPIDYRREAEAALLENYAPPALVVDQDLRIVHFQGDVSPYLAPATGQPSFHLLKMVRPEFVLDLRAAVSKAKKSGVAVRQPGHSGLARIEVRPLRKHNGKKQDFLVVFRKPEPPVGEAGHGAARAVKPPARLERELAVARDHLRALIAEHETAQEEMKAANEEILSSNEELQSTNEELETAKEELQSSNEELVTLNDELQHRNAELNVLTHDLSNLLIGVDIPVLVLDADLRVRRFTPMAGALLNLIAGDVGRPFSNIASTLDVADWNGLFSEVTNHGRLIDREVADRSGHRYSMRLRPYKTDGNAIAGVLVVLFDVDMLQRKVEEAREARDLAVSAEQRAESILNSLTAHIAVIGRDGTFLATNDAWIRFARENENPPLHKVGPGVNYLEVCRRAVADGVPEAREALKCIVQVLEGRTRNAQLEYPCHSAADQRWFLMNVSPLKGTRGGAVIAHTDISARKSAEINARRSESTIRALLDSSVQSVIVVNENEKITMANSHTQRMFGYTGDQLVGMPLTTLIPGEVAGESRSRRTSEEPPAQPGPAASLARVPQEENRGRHTDDHVGYFANLQNRPMGASLNLEGRRRDGTRFPVEIGLSGIESNEGKFAVAFVSDITQRRQLEQAASAHAAQVQALAARLLTAQEEERRRVSRELHDQICQQLAALAIDISGYAESPATSSEERLRRIKDLQARVVKASEATRHIAYELHPSVLDDLGLVASLGAQCREFSQREGIAVQFGNGVMPASIPREVASCLYRVAQEGLQNIARHSGAKQVTVELSVRDEALLLTIVDDGTGFDLEAVRGKGGLGLVGMEERARLVSGKLSITARPRPDAAKAGKGKSGLGKSGTRIALEVPLTAGAP